MAHNILFYGLIIGAFLSIGVLIAKFWLSPVRGFTQLTVFTLSEIGFLCNKGIPCSNCLLSFGVCPIGTLQRLAFIPLLPFYIILLVIAAIGLVFGSLLCAWGCPVGFVQDVLHSPRSGAPRTKVRGSLLSRNPKSKAWGFLRRIKEIKITNKLKTIRYLSLFLVAALIFLELKFQFLSKNGIGIFQEVTIFFGGTLLITAIFIKRPFCRIFCPLGLIYGKLNKVSPIKVPLNKNKCSACGSCVKVCVSDIEPIKDVNKDLCVKCFNCLKICKLRQKDSGKK